MGKLCKKSVSQYLLIALLSIALILTQTGMLHMHVHHNDVHSAVSDGYVVDLHTTSELHNIHLDAHHHDGLHHASIDISQDNLLKNTNVLNILAFIIIFIGFIRCIPRVSIIRNKWFYKHGLNASCYFLKPLLRAPPLQ